MKKYIQYRYSNSNICWQFL